MNTDEPTAYDRFVTDATKRAHLKALLADPVMQEAMDIADDLMRPRCGTASDNNQPLSIAKFHQSAGADQFIQNLRRLTKEKPIVTKLTERKLAKTLEDLPPTAQE